MAKRVLLITPFRIRDDPRFKRHAEALSASSDFEVITASPGPGLEQYPTHVELPGDQPFIRRSVPMIAALAARRYSQVFRLSPFYNGVRRTLPTSDVEFDAILCSDLELVPISMEIAKGREVFVDLREYYPQQFESDIRWRLLFKPLMNYMTAHYSKLWAGSMTVSPGLVDLYETNYGFAPELVTNAAAGRQPSPRPTATPIRMVHSGVANPSRRLDVLIEAADGMRGVEMDLIVLSMPHMMKHRAELEKKASETTNVRVLPPVPAEQLPKVHDAYDVGVCVFPDDSPQLNFTLPNKFFDYVQAGLAVVAGPGVDMLRIVQNFDLGPAVYHFDVPTLRGVFARLNPESVDVWKRNSCGAAGSLDSRSSADRLRALLISHQSD